MTLSPSDIAHWQTWVGRTESRTEMLDREALRRFAAAIGEPLDVEAAQPSLAHWAFFLPVAAADVATAAARQVLAEGLGAEADGKLIDQSISQLPAALASRRVA